MNAHLKGGKIKSILLTYFQKQAQQTTNQQLTMTYLELPRVLRFQ